MIAWARRSSSVLGGLGLLLLLLAPAAAAHFNGTSSASLTLGTASLAAPADLAATCTRAGNILTLTVTWGTTPSATTYDVQHRAAATTTWTASGTVAAPTTSLTIAGLDHRVRDYDVQVTARVGGWSADTAPTPVPRCP